MSEKNPKEFPVGVAALAAVFLLALLVSSIGMYQFVETSSPDTVEAGSES